VNGCGERWQRSAGAWWSFFRNPFITQFALRFHGYCVSVIPA
jgi:hypothetical protein